jgi:hypothetical protein
VSISRQDVRIGPTVMVADRCSVYADPSLAFPEIWDLAPDRGSDGFGSTTFLPVLGIRDILVRIGTS